MYKHVLLKFYDLTSLRDTQNGWIVYEKSMIEHSLVVFTTVDLLEKLRAQVKEGSYNLLSASILKATFFSLKFVSR